VRFAAILLALSFAAQAQTALESAERAWREERWQDANNFFRAAADSNPKNPYIRVRWGRLLLERFNQEDAQGLFKEALDLDPNNAGAMVGLALIAAENFDRRAVELAEAALKAKPDDVEARELLARLALEEGDEAAATKHAAGTPLEPAVRATIKWLATDLDDTKLDAAGYLFAARIFVLRMRYDEAITLYRRALELNPRLWAAHSELGINLMRLARDDEARRHLETAYENGYRNAGTVNTLRLLDSYDRFSFSKTSRYVLKLHAKEAEALKPYFDAEIARATAVYEKKYGHRLSRPVRIEVYPDHEDFAVRALGMPGLGALGVTFGDVVAMDSPSGRPRGSYHWASTLWHELSHVYVLSMTNHRAPRWFVEGVAVHEETATHADWGDRLTFEVLSAIRDKKLLPVMQLDRGFMRPSYPAQVVVSYFQAGRLCDYIAKTWGEQKLVEMINIFAQRKGTEEAIRTALGIAPEELDRRFLAALEAETAHLTAGLDDWRKRMTELNKAAAAGRHDDVIRLGPALRDMFPEYVESGCAYELLVNAYSARGDTAAALAELERYSKAGGRDPGLIKKLATELERRNRNKEAVAALSRLLAVDPLDEELHVRLGGLLLEAGDAAGAIREYSAALALKPHDAAAAHYNLARAYRAANRLENAREELLLALEIAPGYRPAQKMLLELFPN
jgi:tetratricopeptide (TPR) repeat protein